MYTTFGYFASTPIEALTGTWSRKFSPAGQGWNSRATMLKVFVVGCEVE